MLLELEAVNRGNGQTGEDPDAVLQCLEGGAKRKPLLRVRPLDRRRIRDAPVGRHGLPGPEGTDFPGGLVAHREDEIKRRGAGDRELIPALAAQATRRKSHLPEQLEGDRVRGAFGMTAGTQPTKAPPSPMADQA